MEFNAVTEEKWRLLQYHESDVERIQKKAGNVIRKMKALFDTVSSSGDIVLKIDPSGADAIASNLSGTICSGRLKQGWEITNEGLTGKIVVERKIADHRDRDVWEAVFCAFVSLDSHPYYFRDEQKIEIPMTDMHSQRRDNALYELGMQMLYAMINGRNSG